jgi:DNA-binding FadR family transcriptional regulator
VPDPSPRGTYLKIAAQLKACIEADPDMTDLPRIIDVMEEHQVSRGVALRAFGVLRRGGLAEPVPGDRWHVIRDGQPAERRPLHERLEDVITQDNLAVGDLFPSALSLCERFEVSRPTISKALDRMQVDGLLSEARQGKPRTVTAIPADRGR